MIPVTITQTIDFDIGEAKHEKTLKYSVVCKNSKELFQFVESMESLQKLIYENLRADADVFWAAVKKAEQKNDQKGHGNERNRGNQNFGNPDGRPRPGPDLL